MRFLNRLRRTWLGWFKMPADTSSSDSDHIRNEERDSAQLARYLFQSNHVAGGLVTHKAFMPPPDLELSTYNVDGLSSPEIWALGDTVKTESGRPTLQGRAQIAVANVIAAELRALKAAPPPRHVVVVGWGAPTDKAIHKAKAQKLAALAVYHAYGSTT
jgi:hypothetical protein